MIFVELASNVPINAIILYAEKQSKKEFAFRNCTNRISNVLFLSLWRGAVEHISSHP